jgi:cytochrome c-type biogenesis protein CcmH
VATRICGSRRAAVALLLAMLVLAVPAPGLAATPRTTLPDVEDEVMCPTCGTLLQLAESPQANDERDFIRREIAQGKTKQEIKDDLEAQFGPRVLALPPASGFDLSAYLVPAIAIAAAAIAIALGLRRWRRSGGEPPEGGAPLDSTESARLDADLARYDL